MSIANTWKISAVVTPGGQISQIVDQDYQAGIEEMLEGGSGSVDPEYVAVGEAKPMLSFSTTALATALGIVGLNAYNITSATDFYFRRVAQGGVPEGGANHIKMTISAGMIVPMRLSGRQGRDPARLSYNMYARTSDGLTAPIAIATGQTLPTIDTVSELFTIGTVAVNAGGLQAVQSIDWDFGIQPDILGDGGTPYPTYTGVAYRRMRCAINGLDMTAFSTHGLNGLALTSFRTYFRKVAEGGTRVAAGTAEHVRLQGTEGMLLPRGARGPHDRYLEGEWNIVPTFDGTNDTVAVSTGAAIT